MKTIVTALFLLLFLVQKTGAINYYMDAVNGSNSNNGLTPATAFQTLSKVSYTTYSNPVRITLKEKEEASLSLFPNPVINAISISHSKAGTKAIITSNAINGVEMETFRVRADAVQISVDVSDLRPGICD